MIKCACGGEVDYYLSDIHFIKEDNQMRTGVEGYCKKCDSNVYVKFLAVKVEISNSEREEPKSYNIERISGQIAKPLFLKIIF